jgi:hypothetical protein
MRSTDARCARGVARSRWWLLWPAVLAATTWGAACSSAPVDDGDDPEEGGSGGLGGGGGSGLAGATGGTGGTQAGMPTQCTTTNLNFNDPACGTCAAGECCDPLQACDTSMDCLTYLDCVGDCTDQPCADACATATPGGKTLLDALDACLDGSCMTQCGDNSFPICDSGFSVPDEACATCLGDSCCEAIKDCEVEEDCNDCATGTAAACETSTLDEPVRDCWNTSCSEACGEASF